MAAGEVPDHYQAAHCAHEYTSEDTRAVRYNAFRAHIYATNRPTQTCVVLWVRPLERVFTVRTSTRTGSDLQCRMGRSGGDGLMLILDITYVIK